MDPFCMSPFSKELWGEVERWRCGDVESIDALGKLPHIYG